jgi:predicted transcriptional regulator
MSPKKLISTRVSNKTDEQLNELADAQGETKAHIIARAIDQEYEKYKLEQEKLAEAEAVRLELEQRVRDSELQLKTINELEKAAEKFSQIAQKLGQYPDPKIIESLQAEMAEALKVLERVREERAQADQQS